MIYNVYSKPNNYYQNFENYKSETWKKVLETNLTGAFFSSQFLIKYFKKKIKGNLIFLLSTYGIVGPNYKIYEGLKNKKYLWRKFFVKYSSILHNYKKCFVRINEVYSYKFW